MGCFNLTCGITQFPICHNDDVVVFILVESPRHFSSRHAYKPNDLGWHIMPIPLYGTYNDYGWIDSDDPQTKKLEFMANFYKELLVPNIDNNDRRLRDAPDVTNPFIDLETLGDSIHSGYWDIRGHRGFVEEPMRIDFFMIHQMVWDELTSQGVTSYPKATYELSAMAEIVDQYAKEYLDVRTQVVTDYVSNSKSKTLTMEQGYELHDSIGLIGHKEKRKFETEFLDKIEHGYYNPAYSAIQRVGGSREFRSSELGFDFKLIKPLTNGVVTSEEVVRISLLYTAMQSLRKGFMPQMGYSQCRINHEHNQLISVMNKLIERENEWRDE